MILIFLTLVLLYLFHLLIQNIKIFVGDYYNELFLDSRDQLFIKDYYDEVKSLIIDFTPKYLYGIDYQFFAISDVGELYCLGQDFIFYSNKGNVRTNCDNFTKIKLFYD
jgi:hypothetical protein